MGTKYVTYNPGNGKVRKVAFQVGDKITRNLLAVSGICADGATVVFGPGPEFKSFICHDPDAFLAHNGDITEIQLSNGVYEIKMRELYKTPMNNIDGDSEKPGANPSGSSSSEAPPPEAQPQVPDEPATAESETENPEQQIVRPKHSPTTPTAAEMDAHSTAGHCPYRSWCSICVRGRGREDPHSTSKHECIFPTFSSDYCFMNSLSEDETEKCTIYVVKEHKSKSVFATVVPRKGIMTEEAVASEFML